VILTVDLGTSATKVLLWGDEGPIASGRSELVTRFSRGNRAEQDAASWWPSIVGACAEARGRAPEAFSSIEAICFSAARQTFTTVDAGGSARGEAILWSDRRAASEAATISHSCGGVETMRQRTGIVLDAGSMAAKLAWLSRNDPDRLRAARWILAPRDLIVWRLTGVVATDVTLASATGLYETGRSDGAAMSLGPLVGELAGRYADLLPSAVTPQAVIGAVTNGPASELGVPQNTPVVIGAGDRACEVLGAGASARRPMVSWGTTANVSIPSGVRPHPVPEGVIVTMGALGGWLVEGGLSAAGSVVEWLGRLTSLDTSVLMDRAAKSSPGARGIVALPWLGGARAPWWRDSARAAFVGLTFDHDAGDMARAIVESVAWDVVRCLEAATSRGAGLDAPKPLGIVLGGGGASDALWVEVLSAVTGLAARRRRSGAAASAGAALLARHALGQPVDLDRIDPIAFESSPDPEAVARYQSLRPIVDQAALAILRLPSPPDPQGLDSPRTTTDGTTTDGAT
jgi:xylulokinase